MTTRGHRAIAPAAILLVAVTVSGCGIKNLPKAPSSGETPSVVSEQERGGNTSVFGIGNSGGGNDTQSAVAVRRIAGVDGNDTVSAAEVTRNPKASKRSFFLDPLLN